MFGELAVVMALAHGVVMPAAVERVGVAPSDVSVAWAAQHVGYRDVQLTWQEAGDFRDRVTVVALLHGERTVLGPFFVEAGQADEFTLGGDKFRFTDPADYDQLKFEVQAVDQDGNPISDVGSSPVFDAYRSPAPRILALTPLGGDRVEMTWQVGTTEGDDNEHDPLDGPADAGTTYQPGYAAVNQDDLVPFGKPLTGHRFVAELKAPGLVGVSTENGFGRSDGLADLWGAHLTAKIPHTAVTGRPISITGTSVQTIRDCFHPGPHCKLEVNPDVREIDLQARTSARAPWTTVATTTSERGLVYGVYDFEITSPGTREYRVTSPSVPGLLSGNAEEGAETPAVLVRSTGGGSGSGGAGGGGGLPITGSPASTIAALGGLLVAAGLALAYGGRGRRRTASGR